jgi:hypothetical protein
MATSTIAFTTITTMTTSTATSIIGASHAENHAKNAKK